MIDIVDLGIESDEIRAPIIRRLDLRVGPGEIYTLIGPAKAGKTAALEAIAEVRPIARGCIRVGALEPVSRNDRNRRERLTAIWSGAALDDDLTVRQNIRLILRLAGAELPAPAAIDRALRRVDLPDRAFDQSTRFLTAMQKTAAWLAVARLRRTPVILIDEPTASLGGAEMQGMRDLLEDLRSEGHAILLATRDTEFGCSVASTVGVLEHGQKATEGSPETVFRREVIA